MADQIPTIRSYEQYLSDALRAYAAKTGINDFNVGGGVTSFFEVVALIAARASGDALQIIRDTSVDRASGEALLRIAEDEGLSQLPARVASGTITVSDSSFQKISTKIYAGTKAPNVGSTIIFLSDASTFPSTGSVYIGRGTPNVEGAIPYTALVQVGGYWQMTLSAPTTRFHNINESVILSQGGVRNVPTGTVVRVPALGASPEVTFSVTESALILDGEVEVQNVKISAQQPGSSGNASSGAIKEFSTTPFPGATVTNPLPLRTGRDAETDPELRVRIKRARLSRGYGTALAVKNSVVNASASDEQSTIVSDEIVTDADRTTLYIDDGNLYEEKTRGVGIEAIVDSALGGEDHFQLETGGRQTAVAKAFLISTLKAPFDLKAGDTLAVTIAGVTKEHTFVASDFVSQGGATAYEAVASINANSTLHFQATTAGGGTQIVIKAKEESNESIQVADPTTGRNVAELVGLPSNKAETLRLFKNKMPLSKDGNLAFVSTEGQSAWSSTIAGGDTLIVSVDGTPSITYTINNSDFISEGSYPTVSATNSLDSWANVFNAKITGITASVVGDTIVLKSNLGYSNRASISIDPLSTLVSKGMFSQSAGLSSQGKQSDYVFSRNTGQIKLLEPLSAGDQLSAGTEDTEARVLSEKVLGGILTFATDAYCWVVVDDNSSSVITTGLTADSLFSVTKPGSNTVTYNSVISGAFVNVQVGDYVIVWSEELSASNRLEGRVSAVTSTSFSIKVTSAEYAAAVAESGILFKEGIVFVRTERVPQKLKVAAGNKTLSQIANELNTQVSGCLFSVEGDEQIIFKTLTKNTDGAVQIVTFDNSGKILGFTQGDSSESSESLLAFYESGYEDVTFPSFVHSDFSTEGYADPSTSFINSISSTANLSSLNLDPSLGMGFLQPYSAVLDALSPKEKAVISDFSGTSLTIKDNPFVKRLRILDRFFVSEPLSFSDSDELVAVLDNDTTNKTFPIPFYRKAETNTTLPLSSTQFNAYDVDGGTNEPFSSYFSGFDFSNFKILMKAKNVLDPSGSDNSILFRSKLWGASGEKINVGYIYPTAPNLGIQHTASVDKDVNIRISLKSDASVSTTIDGTTEWNVTITPNTPVAGVDQVTYTWTGTGTAPGLAALSGGEYVNISKEGEFSEENTGVYRVSTEAGFTPTATSFSVVRPIGAAIAESNKASNVPNNIVFFASLATTAAEIVTYIDANLSSFITAVAEGTGSGTIDKSTYEESNFAYSSVYLKDGVNWISSSNVSGSPQFVLKKPLQLASATDYAFNDGEEIRIVPTTVEQVARFIKNLAVSGLTTVGNVNLTTFANRLELSTQTLGGDGSVQIVGGLANSVETPVIGNSVVFDNQYVRTGVFAPGILGIQAGSWVKLQSENLQDKEISLEDTSTISIKADHPTVGSSKITLGNKLISNLYFGKPRLHQTTQNRQFKVEKQGLFACISYTGTGGNPYFSKTLNLDDSLGGTVNVYKVDSSESQYIILSGNANFSEAYVGDILTVSGMPDAENNGSFIVTGVSNDGTTIQVTNPNAVNMFSSSTFTITNNANVSGDSFIVNGVTKIAGTDFPVGATANDTAINLASSVSSIAGVTATASSNVVTVIAILPAASITTSYVDAGGGGASVSGPALVGHSFASGDFSCVAEISEGDTITIGSAFHVLNRGKFRVIRRYENSIYVDNPKSVQETVTASGSAVSIGIDGTTEFDVDASDNSQKLIWTGTGTIPNFSNVNLGDEVEFGTDFSVANRGVFKVSKVNSGEKERIRLTVPVGSAISSGNYFLINSALDSTMYYVWFNVDGAGGNPLLPGKTGIQVNISSSATASAVASLASAAINLISDFSSSYSFGNTFIVENSNIGISTNASTGTMPVSFSIEFLDDGEMPYLEVINASAVSETGITISDVLVVVSPDLKFYPYETTVAGDKIIIGGSFLGSSNEGTWVVTKLLSDSVAIVTGTMVDKTNISLLGNTQSIILEEEKPYVGYKKVYSTSLNPDNTALGYIIFDSRHQANKITESGYTSISSVSKLGYSNLIKNGVDSYKYQTGLLGEANRIVYGDPRDTGTYPGVAAAGAEIFIKEPLPRRVKLGIDVRLETGIPFVQIVEQVRTNIAALINSNEIGKSIAISDIVSAVNTIPGVSAVAISSPLYNPSNDTIKINPSEKARIIDYATDIAVSKIG